MIFGGLQKVSLIDYPGKVSSVVFTQGCLFRCPFCHNPELIGQNQPGNITAEEILGYLNEHKNFLDGVCITGGEPTIHKDLPEFINKINALGLAVKLDTNGTNPEMVKLLLANKSIDYLAMDLKNSWENYDLVANIGNQTALANCQKTFSLIQNSGLAHEFRTTVFPAVHTEADFMAMVKNLQPGEKYFIQNIRYLKTLDPKIDQTKTIDVPALVAKLQRAFPQVIIASR